MSDALASSIQRFDALHVEHSMAARVSRRLSDESFTSLLSAGSELLELDQSGDVKPRIVEAMVICIRTLMFSATGAYREEYAVPDAAGYLLDAIYAYTLLADEALFPSMGSIINDESRSTFRDLIRARTTGI